MSDFQISKKELALSNSLLHSHNMGQQKKLAFDISDFIIEKGFVNCYIDRLTIVGNLPSEYEGDLEPFGFLPFQFLARFGGCGWRGQIFPDRKQKIYVEYDPDNSKKMRKRNFRVECNPNLLCLDQLQALFSQIVPLLTKVSISRIDLAFDFERNLSEFVFDKSVSGAKYWDKSGRTQTIYFGAPSSDFRCRLYDKKAERFAKGSEEDKEEYKQFDTLWRLEYELTGSGYIENQVRKDFRMIQETKITKRNFDLALDVPLSATEKIFLKAYDENKDDFNLLGKNTKTKYRKLADMISSIDLTDGLRNVIREMQICSDYPFVVSATDFCMKILSGINPIEKIE